MASIVIYSFGLQIANCISSLTIKIKKMKSLIKTTGFKSIATLLILVITSVSTYAATTSTSEASNGFAIVGGVALLIGAIVLPAFKSSKI
jgi:hypothetical protein